MRELLKIVNKRMYLLLFILGIIFSVAQSGQSVFLAVFATSPLNEKKILYLLLSIAVTDLIMWGVNWCISYFTMFSDIKTRSSILEYYFSKIEKMSSKKLSDVHTGYMQNLIFDVSNGFLDIMWFIINSIISFIIGIITFLIMACRQSVWTGIISLFLILIAIICKYKMIKNRQKYEKETRAKKSEAMSTFIDFVQNIITVKKLNIRKYCIDSLSKKNDEYISIGKKSERKKADTNLVFHLLMSSVYIVVLVSSLIMTRNGGDALPYLLFYFSLLGNLYGDINSIVYMIDSLVSFNTAKKQLDEKIGKLNELNVVKNFNEIELKKCRFKYNKNSVPITIPNFKIKKGEKISITGESGQGKTTAMNILSGLYDLTEGELLIDGKEVKNTRLDLVFVSQEVDLFDMTIRENLCLGKDIKESKILELFEDAGLTEWFLNLENGLETVVGEKGVKLSAGQKQRLNLIRGILIDKDLYFFDEPTSNLDSVSEEKITNMIEKYLSDKTYVIVTHRPRLTGLCNKHYRFENHIMSEALYNAKK